MLHNILAPAGVRLDARLWRRLCGAVESTPRPGHPPVDIALRLRNWAWYWSVKRITGCSDDRVDALYVLESKDGTRRRFFQRLCSLSLKAHGSQRRYIQALVEAHLATPAKGTSESHAAWPIVVQSPRVAWIEARRDVLETAANKLYGPEAIGCWKPGDPNVPELFATNPEEMRAYIARLVEGQMAWHAYADWVSKNIKPPPPDMRYCLPVQPGS